MNFVTATPSSTCTLYRFLISVSFFIALKSIAGLSDSTASTSLPDCISSYIRIFTRLLSISTFPFILVMSPYMLSYGSTFTHASPNFASVLSSNLSLSVYMYASSIVITEYAIITGLHSTSHPLILNVQHMSSSVAIICISAFLLSIYSLILESLLIMLSPEYSSSR